MPTNPYSSVSISGYNANPPSDDAAQVSSNRVQWQKHLDKIGDPLRTALTSVDSNVAAAFSSLVMTTAPDEETVIIAMQEYA